LITDAGGGTPVWHLHEASHSSGNIWLAK